MWVQLAIAVGMLIVSYAITLSMQPKAQKPIAGEFDIPSAKSGDSIPVVFGTVLIKQANIIDYGFARTRPIKSKGGKK